MALRGDYLVLKAGTPSGSGTANVVIAESTSVTIDFSAEALETTSQTSGLSAEFIAGKVTGTASGDYLLASDGSNFDNLYDLMAAGTKTEFEVYRSGSLWYNGAAVITNISMSGGNSDQLVTGSYSMTLSGTITQS